MSYITNSHKGYTFDQDYKQIFKNKWNNNVSSQVVVNMKDNGLVNDDDITILKFLFKTHFATAEMLYRLLGSTTSFDAFEARLEKHVKNRLINKFCLSQYEGEEIPNDALLIYCLDIGGKLLLSHFSNLDTTNWYTIENKKCPELITRDLVSGNFLIKLQQACPDKIKFFRTNANYRIGRTEVVFSLEFGLMIDGRLKYFVGEVIRDYDYPIGLRDKVVNFDQVLASKVVKKYFVGTDDQPIFIGIAEDDRNAVDAFKIFNESEILKVFVSTDERLTKDLSEKGTFLMADRASGKIGQVALDIFK